VDIHPAHYPKGEYFNKDNIMKAKSLLVNPNSGVPFIANGRHLGV
jgi:hypothetical protein